MPSDEPTTTEAADRQQRLRALLRYHMFNCWLFWIAMTCIFIGTVIALAFLNWTVFIPVAGFVIAGVLLAQCYIVYPFLRCPFCGNRFFTLNGVLGLLDKINPHRRTCRHCDKGADQP